MARVYVGNIDPRVTERELEDEFRNYGVLRSVWVARKPPGFAFIEFDDHRDAQDAIRALNGKQGWRVELSRASGGGGGGPVPVRRGGGEDMRCYECGEPGHFARECRMRVGGGGGGGGGARGRSPPRYRRSPDYGGGRERDSPRRRSPSPRRRSPSPGGRRRSPSPGGRRRSPSPDRRRGSRSPPPRARSPPAGSPRRDERSPSPRRRRSRSRS